MQSKAAIQILSQKDKPWFNVRPLVPEDAGVLEKICSEALIEEGWIFSIDTHQSEIDWKSAVQPSKERVVLGAFLDNSTLIGIMAAKRSTDNPARVLCFGMYVLPEHRNVVAERQLYKALDKWSLDQGYTEITFLVHPDDTASLVRSAQGATFMGRQKIERRGRSVNAIRFNKTLKANGLNLG